MCRVVCGLCFYAPHKICFQLQKLHMGIRIVFDDARSLSEHVSTCIGRPHTHTYNEIRLPHTSYGCTRNVHACVMSDVCLKYAWTLNTYAHLFAFETLLRMHFFFSPSAYPFVFVIFIIIPYVSCCVYHVSHTLGNKEVEKFFEKKQIFCEDEPSKYYNSF